jgi:hypothetical protein
MRSGRRRFPPGSRHAAGARLRLPAQSWRAAVRPAATPPRSGAAPALRIAEAPADRRQSAVPEEGRRTIRIQGRGADPYRSDPSLRARSGFESSPLPRSMANSPDRLAMWATLLGFLLVVVAILSSHL